MRLFLRVPSLTALATLALGYSSFAFGAAGELDTAFNTIGFVKTNIRGDDFANAMAVQSDGKVVVVGSASSADFGSLDFAVVRYTNAGGLDTTFGTGGKVTTSIGTGNDMAFDVAMQADGKIVVAGETNDAAGSNANFVIVRYNTNGALDTTFGTGGKVTTGIGTLDDFATCLALQSDGKILVAGYSYTGADTTNIAVVRYNTNGALDTTFNTTGKLQTDLGGVDVAEAIAIQSNGKIVVAGFITNTVSDYANSAIVRYNANGSLDTTFNTTGKLITNMGPTFDYIDGIAVQSDGKIVTAGTMIDAGIGVARYTTSGALDTTFNGSGKIITAISGTGSSDSVHSVALQADGKIIVAGSTLSGDQDDVALVRFTDTGSLDSGFGVGGKAITNFSSDAGPDYAYSVKVLSDGGILIAGDSSTTADGYDFFLARYQSTGVAVPMPVVTTNPASDITGTTVTLNGIVNAQDLISTVTFEYGPTTAYGTTVAATPGTLATSTDTEVSAALADLAEGTTYHFRIRAVTADGRVEGSDRSFSTTAAPPPVITAHPRNVTAEVGTSIDLEVQATGTGLAYQWQRNDQNIVGQTASTLSISNFQSAQAGIYTCIVSNSSGSSTTSDPALISFVTTLSTALDMASAHGQTADPAAWSVVTTGTRDGVDALKSGSPVAGESSKLSTLITGPVRLSYFYKLSATDGAAFLRTSVDGVQAQEFTGSVDWTGSDLLIPIGTHRVEFSFDQTVADAASEAAWLDQMALGSSTWITAQPVSRIATIDDDVTFEIGIAGLATTCQWRKNGVAIPGATGSQLTLSKVAATDAALYTVALGTGTISSTASLSVVNPVMLARAPLGKTATFTQTLTNAVGATFQWQRSGVNLSDGTKYSGTRTAKLSVKLLSTLDAGVDYTCIVKLGTLTHVIGPCELAIQSKPVVDAVAVQSTIISGAYRLQLTANEGPIITWAATGLPSGVTINSTSGLISGSPNVADKLTGPYSVIITATNAAGVSEKYTFLLSIAPQPAGTTGTWMGLIERHSLLNADIGGRLSISVTGTGTFTGTLHNGKDTHTLSSRLVTDPTTGISIGTQTIARTGRTALILSFTIDPAQGTLIGSISSAGAAASLDACRNPWSSGVPATTASGLYNNAMELPFELVGDTTVPQGAGWTQLNVSALGTVTVSGRVADGTAFTGSSIFANDRRLPLFVPLYTYHGSLHGHQVIATDGSVASDALTWVKTGPISVTDKTYASGYRIALSTSGAKYVKPTVALPVVLGLPDRADNAMIQFIGAEIETALHFTDLQQTLRITKTNTTSFRTTTTGNPCNVKMTVTASTGVFSGTFTLTDPGTTKAIVRTVSYYGVLLSHRQAGVGCFMLPGLVVGSPVQGGMISLLPTGTP